MQIFIERLELRFFFLVFKVEAFVSSRCFPETVPRGSGLGRFDFEAVGDGTVGPLDHVDGRLPAEVEKPFPPSMTLRTNKLECFQGCFE
jgi:hypothetical protein